MKHAIITILCCCLSRLLPAQVKWSDDSLVFSNIQWNNYSTSYMGKDSDTIPLLITALPYNGIYEMGDHDDRTAVNLTFSGSAFRFRSNLSDNQRQFYTYDSSDVYFLAPGIFRYNAARYEFRVLQDNRTSIQPWTDINQFTDPDFGINNFKTGFAFLGGYTTSWDHFLVMELRVKGQEKILSASVVYWKQTRPVLSNIYTSSEFNEFLLKRGRTFDNNRWSADTALPKTRILSPGETSLIFFCNSDIYKKEALEYKVLKNDRVYRDWAPNDYNNNSIWLKNLGPGNYMLQMRYRKQRHNITEYPFAIRPAWYQTWAFRIVTLILILVSFGSMGLLLTLQVQKKKMAAEQAKKERQTLELQSVRAQLNPHFIFNALSSIQGLINKGEIGGANRYLSDFGDLVRNSLTDSTREFVPLEREIHTLNIYCSLEQLRFSFSYSIHCADDVPVPETEIPALLLQPLVENAVKHGVAGLQEKGHIRIGFSRSNKDLLVRIQDNGKGFNPTVKYQGFGLKLTRDRIRLLNEMQGEPFIEWNIDGSGGGACITIVFKNWLS